MRPLEGTLVLDASRMLPGAVLARLLIELGARLVKIEHPAAGDPQRGAPPFVDGTGAGFRAMLAGSESLALDLRDPLDAARLRKLARHADVLIDSFRPGTLTGLDLGVDRLRSVNPSLVICRLPAFGSETEGASPVAHDLNLVAQSGLLSLLPGDGLPRVQFADVATGLLAAGAVLAALLERRRSGVGRVVDQPLVTGPRPFVGWAVADAAAGGGGLNDPGGLLTGGCPAYRVYPCADGKALAVGALEPKFWSAFVALLDLAEIENDGLDTGDAGRIAAEKVAQRLLCHPREHWLRMAAGRDLPLSPVRSIDEAGHDPQVGGPFLPAFAEAAPARPAPRLGEHTASILAEFALE